MEEREIVVCFSSSFHNSKNSSIMPYKHTWLWCQCPYFSSPVLTLENNTVSFMPGQVSFLKRTSAGNSFNMCVTVPPSGRFEPFTFSVRGELTNKLAAQTPSFACARHERISTEICFNFKPTQLQLLFLKTAQKDREWGKSQNHYYFINSTSTIFQQIKHFL